MQTEGLHRPRIGHIAVSSNFQEVTMQRITLLSMIFVLLFSTGCTSNRYPTRWSDPVSKLTPDGCSGIVGIYANANGSTYLDRATLTALLSGGNRASQVEISVPHAGALKIRGYRDEYLLFEHEYSEQDKNLTCEPSGARISFNLTIPSEWGVEVLHRVLLLGRNGDGDLITKLDDTGGGLVLFIIPLPDSSSAWYRFKSYACNDTALLSNTTDDLRLRHQGDYCFWVHEYDRSIEYYQKAMQLERFPTKVYLDIGRAWYKKSDFDRARQSFDEAARADPESNSEFNSPYYWRGKIQFITGHYDASAADLTKSMKLLALDDQPHLAPYLAPYLAIWKYLALARSDNQAIAIQELSIDFDKTKNRFVPAWTNNLMMFFEGKIDDVALYKSIEESHVWTEPGYNNPPIKRIHTCEADLFVGEWHLLHGRKQTAKSVFLHTENDCPKYSYEYIDAHAELARIRD